MPPTLPNGMSVADAERLSREQQNAVNKNRVQEGQIFYRNIGEGGRQLSIIKNGKIYGLGYSLPKLSQQEADAKNRAQEDAVRQRIIADNGGREPVFSAGNDWARMFEGMYNTNQLTRFQAGDQWGGKTGGQWQNEATNQYLSQLGLSPDQIQTAHPDFLQGFTDQSITDVNQFRDLLGGSPNYYGGPTTNIPQPADLGIQTPGAPQNPNTPATPPTGTPPTGQIQAAMAPTAPTAPTTPTPQIPFKQGLTEAQQQSIIGLVNNKPTSQWNATDRANWSYATNNAQLPGTTGSTPPAQELGSYISDPGMLKNYSENEIVRTPDGKIYTKPGIPLRSGNTSQGDTGTPDQGTPGETPSMWEDLFGSQYGKLINQMLSAYSDPYTYATNLYKQIYADNGLTTVKQQIDNVNKQITDLANERDAKLRNINDDPWLTEGVRLKRNQKIADEYSDKEKNLVNQFNLYKGIWETGTQQAQFVMQQALTMHAKGQEMTQDLIFKAIDVAQKQADSGAKDIEWGVIGQHVDPTTYQLVNDYGFIDKKSREIMGNAGSTPSGLPGSGVVDGIDIGNYAADPNYVSSIQRNLGQIGQMHTSEDITNYIKSKAPNSPITADMIRRTSEKYGLPWETIMAMLQQESNFGTSNVAKNNNNAVGMTWTGKNGQRGTARPASEGGYYVKYNNIADSIDALGANLAGRKVSPQTTPTNPIVDQDVQNWANAINRGEATFDQASKILPKGKIDGLLPLISNQNKEATDLQKNALTSAEKLYEMFKTNKTAVGASAIFNSLYQIPGSKEADFVTQYNNLKGLLALDNVKYLKGQGSVSDAERKLLADASSNLNRFSSETTFLNNLNNVLATLRKATGTTGTGGWTSPSGRTYNLPN